MTTVTVTVLVSVVVRKLMCTLIVRLAGGDKVGRLLLSICCTFGRIWLMLLVHRKGRPNIQHVKMLLFGVGFKF